MIIKPIKALLFIFVVILGVSIASTDTAGASGAGPFQPSDRGRLIVSATGTYNSPLSVSFLYVPIGQPNGSVQLNNVVNQINTSTPRMKYFSVRPVVDPSNNCGSTIIDAAPQINYGDDRFGVSPTATINFSNSSSLPQTVVAGSTTYKKYCVFVSTDSSVSTGNCSTAVGCYHMNVTFSLQTSAPQTLGNYSGPAQNAGTGLFRTLPVPAFPGRFSKVIDFSLPCGVSPGGLVWMYDLDTYQGDGSGGDNEDQYYEIQVADKGANNWASIPLTSSWSDTRSAGTNRYHPWNVPTSGNVSTSPVGDFQPDKKYRLIIAEIARNNKIRINLPSDQILNEVPCVDPDTATCSISNIVTFSGGSTTITPEARIQFTVTTTDASGYRVGVNGPSYGNEYGSTNIGNYLVTGSQFARGPTMTSNSVTRTVTSIAYSDTGALNSNINAPGTAGTYAFNWGLVLPGTGWKSVTCTGSITVSNAPIPGCTDPSATNYNPSATTDDGSCVLPLSCPSYPDFPAFNNAIVTINLVNNGKRANELVPLAPPSGSWSGTTLQDTRSSSTGLTAVRQVRDNSNGILVRTYGYTTTNPIARLSPSVNPAVRDFWGQAPNYNAASASDGTLEVDYTPFMDYPYDSHTATATYQRRVFTRRNLYDYTRVRTYEYERETITSSWVQVSAGNNGWSSSRASFTDSSPYWGDNVTANGATMPPCFPRNYEVRQTNANLSATLRPDREDPTQSRLTFRMPVRLSYPSSTIGGSLRTPTRITSPGISYTVSWRAEGYSSPVYSGTVSGPLNLTVANNSTGNNVDVQGSSIAYTTTPSPVSFTVPGDLEAGDRVCWTVTIAEPTGTVKQSGEIWQRSGPSLESSNCTLTVVDEPYTRFYGADISAGGGFNTGDSLGTCTAEDPDALAFGSMRTDILAGTGSQLAVFALDAIQGVQPLSRSTRTPTELAFSNLSPSLNSNLFGGNFGTLLCAHNYFEDIPEDTTWETLVSNVDLSSVGIYNTEQHYFDGNITLSGQLPEDPITGKRVVIYVDGNVNIQASAGGKVGFATTSYEWNSIDSVPSLFVIASGNINVDHATTRLDGSFISQGGDISTCTVNGAYPTASQLTEQCRNQLTVNGSFIGSEVNLLRTLGSLRESYPLEVPVRDPTPADPAATTPASSRAAEIFIYNPTTWFIKGGGLPSNSKIQIDSFTSLPPSL